MMYFLFFCTILGGYGVYLLYSSVGTLCGYPVCMSFVEYKKTSNTSCQVPVPWGTPYTKVRAWETCAYLCKQHATMPHRVFSDKLWKLEIQNVLKKPI